MKPSGHFATAIGAAGVSYATTGSVELAAGTFAGGFLIDLDHYVDYVVFERQLSLNPFRFLNYYHTHQYSWLVLGLHSYELMTLLAMIALLTGWQWLTGYLLGAAMHLSFDIAINGQAALRNPFSFYSFFYRWRGGFAKETLLFEPEELKDQSLPVPEVSPEG